jgi:hypothetical protein
MGGLAPDPRFGCGHSAAILVAILAEMHNWPDRRIYQVICLIVVAVTQIVTIIVSRLKTSEVWRWRR